MASAQTDKRPLKRSKKNEMTIQCKKERKRERERERERKRKKEREKERKRERKRKKERRCDSFLPCHHLQIASWKKMNGGESS